MDRTAVFVDAWYLTRSISRLIPREKTRHRDRIFLHQNTFLQLLGDLVVELTGLPLLRVYWYDCAGAEPTHEQLATADKPNVKLRLGSLNTGGTRKGVASLVVSDLATLARYRSMASALLLTGDEDVRVGVQQAQEYGVRVHLLGIAPARQNQSRLLVQEADDVRELSPEEVQSFFFGSEPPTVSTQAASEAPPSIPPMLEDIAQQVAAELSAEERAQVVEKSAGGWWAPAHVRQRLLFDGVQALGGMPLTNEQKKQIRATFLNTCRTLTQAETPHRNTDNRRISTQPDARPSSYSISSIARPLSTLSTPSPGTADSSESSATPPSLDGIAMWLASVITAEERAAVLGASPGSIPHEIDIELVLAGVRAFSDAFDPIRKRQLREAFRIACRALTPPRPREQWEAYDDWVASQSDPQPFAGRDEYSPSAPAPETTSARALTLPVNQAVTQQVAAELSSDERETMFNLPPGASFPPAIDRRLALAATEALGGTPPSNQQKRSLRNNFRKLFRIPNNTASQSGDRPFSTDPDHPQATRATPPALESSSPLLDKIAHWIAAELDSQAREAVCTMWSGQSIPYEIDQRLLHAGTQAFGNAFDSAMKRQLREAFRSACQPMQPKPSLKDAEDDHATAQSWDQPLPNPDLTLPMIHEITRRVALKLSAEERKALLHLSPDESIPPNVDAHLMSAAAQALGGADLDSERRESLRSNFVKIFHMQIQSGSLLLGTDGDCTISKSEV